MQQLASILLTDLEEVAAASSAAPVDVLIVGGGSTGLTSARVLAEAGQSVAVLEAGPLALLTHASSTDLRFSPGAIRGLQQQLSYSPTNAQGERFGALVSCLGGRGIFWNGAAPRYLEADFAGWPLAPRELDPHYEWAERELFVSEAWGRTRIATAMADKLRKAGLPAEPEPFAVASEASINGRLAGTIGNPLTILLRSGLFGVERAPYRPRVVAGARVLKVDGGGGVGPLAVSAESASGQSATLMARTVVLAAGGFESVRLALASGLQDDSGTLGQGLSDHWFVRAYFPLPEGFFDPVLPEAGAVFVRPRAGRPYQLELHVPGRRFFTAESPWRPGATAEYAVMVRAFAPVRGRAQSRVELSPGSTAGRYVVHLSPSPDDTALIAAMRAGLEDIRRALGALEAEIEQMPLGSSYHEAGGLQMSSTREAGVVDSFGRFWADARIRVFDASAWPSIGAANPHLTLVAMAHRQATKLAADLEEG